VQLDVGVTVNRPDLLLSRYIYIYILFIYLFIYLFIVDKTLPYKFISVNVSLHKYLSLNILCYVFVGRMRSWMRCEIEKCQCIKHNMQV
jgi:hypothetical protein